MVKNKTILLYTNGSKTGPNNVVVSRLVVPVCNAFRIIDETVAIELNQVEKQIKDQLTTLANPRLSLSSYLASL